MRRRRPSAPRRHHSRPRHRRCVLAQRALTTARHPPATLPRLLRMLVTSTLPPHRPSSTPQLRRNTRPAAPVIALRPRPWGLVLARHRLRTLRHHRRSLPRHLPILLRARSSRTPQGLISPPRAPSTRPRRRVSLRRRLGRGRLATSTLLARRRKIDRVDLILMCGTGCHCISTFSHFIFSFPYSGRLRHHRLEKIKLVYTQMRQIAKDEAAD